MILHILCEFSCLILFFVCFFFFFFGIQINNAAIIIQKPTVEVTAQEFSAIMAINFESSYHLSQLAHPLLKALGAGIE